MYELAILKELGDRAGYSLNIENIIDIITGSLHQFIKYSAVSYMLLEPESIVFKVHLEESVARNFINDIKERMIKSLSALMDQDFSKIRIEEVMSGAILVEDLDYQVNSFFNIPMTIGGKLVGVLTIAHVKSGLYKEQEMTILYKIMQQASLAVTRLQDVVETEQKKLNDMVQSITEGIVMTDKDYRVLVTNPAVKKILGLQKEEVNIFDFINALDGKFDIRGKLEESVKLNKVLVSSDIILDNRCLQISVSPVENSSNIAREKILGAVAIFHDITHEKELERLREDFTSMIAHELRSPLDGIKKISELMKMGLVKKTKDRTEYIQMIYNNTSDLLGLINNLLDVAKLEAGKFEIIKQPIELKEIIKERVNFFEIASNDAKISLISKFSDDLPKMVEMDQFRIAQVLNNLISNALKFTSAGGEVSVQSLFHQKGRDVSGEAEKAGIKWFLTKDKFVDNGDSVVVAVTDNGIGISAENIPQLFNKFKQVGNKDKTSHSGTGLGLIVAKGIIEAHDGTIGVESKENEGSTFYFTIPVNQVVSSAQVSPERTK